MRTSMSLAPPVSFTSVAGGKAAARPGHLSGIRSGCYDGSLFQYHGDYILLTIDEEIHRNAHRQLIGANDVFDHMVSYLIAKGAGSGEPADLFLRQAGKLCHLSSALLHSQFMKARILIRFHFCSPLSALLPVCIYLHPHEGRTHRFT